MPPTTIAQSSFRLEQCGLSLRIALRLKTEDGDAGREATGKGRLL